MKSYLSGTKSYLSGTKSYVGGTSSYLSGTKSYVGGTSSYISNNPLASALIRLHGDKPFWYGMRWDEFTPAVKGQMLRDAMALSAAIQTLCYSGLAIAIDAGASYAPEVAATLASIGVECGNNIRNVTSWILYKVGEEYPEEPEWATRVTYRDLHQDRDEQPLNPKGEPGYYLPPQGRLAPDTISLLRPAPNGYVMSDPAILMLWT